MPTETLRPNANGDDSELWGNDGNQVNNFEMCDEIGADDHVTYVYDKAPLALYDDLYNIPNSL